MYVYVHIYIYIHTLYYTIICMYTHIHTAHAHLRRSARAYTRSPLEDSRLFGPSPWKILATTYEKRVSKQPSPWRKSCKRESCYGDRVYVVMCMPEKGDPERYIYNNSILYCSIFCCAILCHTISYAAGAASRAGQGHAHRQPGGACGGYYYYYYYCCCYYYYYYYY